MKTRQHVHEESFPVTAEELFSALQTPAAIREWWGAARAIVIPEEGGAWVAAWGADENSPDYVTAATMKVFDPPRRIVFGDYKYYAKAGVLPFQAEFTTEFVVEENPNGATLRVTQDGFPLGSEADEFYIACEQGWRNTFAGIRRFFENQTLVKAKLAP
jgi:uncharacterized protein YndB with AHSA1/START domain